MRAFNSNCKTPKEKTYFVSSPSKTFLSAVCLACSPAHAFQREKVWAGEQANVRQCAIPLDKFGCISDNAEAYG